MSYLAAIGEKGLQTLKMDFFETKAPSLSMSRQCGGFIRETISTSCVAGRGHPTVLWGIRGVPTAH
jgi:hypothetical protein